MPTTISRSSTSTMFFPLQHINDVFPAPAHQRCFSRSSTSTMFFPLQHINDVFPLQHINDAFPAPAHKTQKSVLCTRRKIDCFSESNVQRREDGKVSGGYKPQCAGGNGHRSSTLTGKK
ncbi:hypothetical protein ACB292_14440 [Klebsiella quasipneumoniae]